MEWCKVFQDTRFLVHILVCVFGIASWIDINGLWVELPLIVTVLPESWDLPSYMIVVIQVANIGPLLFGIFTYVCKDKRLEIPTSFLIILIGFAACILLAFFWQETTVIANELHSTALLTLNFILALVDCTSSMAFLAFMSSLKPQYLPSYFIGESLSGLIPSLTALGQGAGQITCQNVSDTNATIDNGTWYNQTKYNVFPMYNEANFSVQVFFFILASMMFLSFVSFTILRFHPYCQSEYVKNNASFSNQDIGSIKSYGTTGDEYKVNGVKTPEIEIQTKEIVITQGTCSTIILLALVAWINFQVSSFLLSLQTYSTLPYGLETYHLTVTLTNIANPVACIFTMFIPLFSVVSITVFTFLGTCCGAYIVICAAMSPTPFLNGTEAGGAVIVTVWVLCIFLLTYAKVGVANVLRTGGRRPLILCGAFTQIGSFTGAIVGFIIINIYHLFSDAPYC